MSPVKRLLAELSARGVALRAVGGDLKLKPSRALDPDLVERLKEYKSEILVLLRQSLAPCGSSHCGGCYDIGEGRKIHPPKASTGWLVWHQAEDRWAAK